MYYFASLGKAINEVWNQVDITRFTPQIDVLNEILGDLPAISAIDALDHTHPDANVRTTQMRKRLEAVQAELSTREHGDY